jgi:hypothetical protein
MTKKSSLGEKLLCGFMHRLHLLHILIFIQFCCWRIFKLLVGDCRLGSQCR